MNQKVIRAGILSIAMFTLAAAGIALTLKANVGVGSFNSFNASMAHALGVKVGTIVMVVNVLCVIGQLVLQRSDFHWRQWLQIPASFILGEGTNLFYYDIYSVFESPHYLVNLLILVLGVLTCCVSMGIILRLNFVSLPLEGFCHVLAKKKGWAFGKVRQSVDIVSVTLSLLTTLFGLPLLVREGTLITLFLFAPVIHRFLHYLEDHRILDTLHFS